MLQFVNIIHKSELCFPKYEDSYELYIELYSKSQYALNLLTHHKKYITNLFKVIRSEAYHYVKNANFQKARTEVLLEDYVDEMFKYEVPNIFTKDEANLFKTLADYDSKNVKCQTAIYKTVQTCHQMTKTIEAVLIDEHKKYSNYAENLKLSYLKNLGFTEESLHKSCLTYKTGMSNQHSIPVKNIYVEKNPYIATFITITKQFVETKCYHLADLKIKEAFDLHTYLDSTKYDLFYETISRALTCVSIDWKIEDVILYIKRLIDVLMTTPIYLTNQYLFFPPLNAVDLDNVPFHLLPGNVHSMSILQALRESIDTLKIKFVDLEYVIVQVNTDLLSIKDTLLQDILTVPFEKCIGLFIGHNMGNIGSYMTNWKIKSVYTKDNGYFIYSNNGFGYVPRIPPQIKLDGSKMNVWDAPLDKLNDSYYEPLNKILDDVVLIKDLRNIIKGYMDTKV